MSYVLFELQVLFLNDQKGPTRRKDEATITIYINPRKPHTVFSTVLQLPHITIDKNRIPKGRICVKNVVWLKKI